MLRIRRDTVESSKPNTKIDLLKQNLIGILGIRGSGKSWLGEALLMKYYDAGFTCLDLWSAPNLENAFWIFAKEDHKKRIPVTILAPEAFIIPEAQVDKFNGDYLTKEELIKFVLLPTPTKKSDTTTNEKILQLLIDAILDCRKHKRILVFNPYMFPNETDMFRTLEILMRNMITISNNYFDALEPEDVGKSSENDMTIRELTYHKMVFLIREFGEVAPARLKGDKSGESTLIKKALLKFVRLARHSNIDGIIDYQNASDVDSSIRNQINIWMIKTWTPELAGESFDYLFQRIHAIRQGIFDDKGYTNASFEFANSFYPPIEKITPQYYYFVRRGQVPVLRRVPELKVRHKEPNDKWWKITGIKIDFDQDLLQKSNATNTTKISKSDEKTLYGIIYPNRSPKSGKRKTWKDIWKMLINLQQSGEITWHKKFSEMNEFSVQKFFKRMEDKENAE